MEMVILRKVLRIRRKRHLVSEGILLHLLLLLMRRHVHQVLTLGVALGLRIVEMLLLAKGSCSLLLVNLKGVLLHWGLVVVWDRLLMELSFHI